ncbi:hypothetical protein LO80_03300 [Candidatus Francisella endociliophora]|uniref:Uncharacterized protein n=1 Tax=Candidatus Francisella endociliophora TaxID=653937 RepID=A0A097ENE9_9GAMM|nr:terminase family protein [Francisella sp. FSC1006]AIT09091.1 hypothetical protein LO80_03300 [Francisella sp. FSC1006]
MNALTLTPKQSTIFRNKARFKVLICGRRFGKTYGALAWLIEGAMTKPNSINTYYAPNQVDAREIAWELLQELLPDNYIKYNEQRLECKFFNGSVIKLRGTDKKLGRGGKNHRLVYDEFAFGNQKKYEAAVSPTLADTKGEALFISSPHGRNWAYDYYLRGLDSSFIDWASFQFTTLDGGNVDQDEIEAKKRELDPRTFRQEYEATFEEAIGRIIYAFEEKSNVISKDIQPEEHEDIWVGMDFNVNPMSAVIAVFRAGIIYQFGEIIIEHSNTAEMCREIKRRFPNHTVYFAPDPAGRARNTSSDNTNFAIIEEFDNFYVYAPDSHQLVEDRHNETNAAFCNANGDHRYFITGNCTKTIKALSGHTYKEGTSTPNKNDGFDHIVDAIGYMVHQLLPIKSVASTSAYNTSII